MFTIQDATSAPYCDKNPYVADWNRLGSHCLKRNQTALIPNKTGNEVIEAKWLKWQWNVQLSNPTNSAEEKYFPKDLCKYIEWRVKTTTTQSVCVQQVKCIYNLLSNSLYLISGSTNILQEISLISIDDALHHWALSTWKNAMQLKNLTSWKVMNRYFRKHFFHKSNIYWDDKWDKKLSRAKNCPELNY